MKPKEVLKLTSPWDVSCSNSGVAEHSYPAERYPVIDWQIVSDVSIDPSASIFMFNRSEKTNSNAWHYLPDGTPQHAQDYNILHNSHVMYFTRENSVHVHRVGRGDRGSAPCIVKISNKRRTVTLRLWKEPPACTEQAGWVPRPIQTQYGFTPRIEPRFPGLPDSNAVITLTRTSRVLFRQAWNEFLIITWTIHSLKQSTHTKNLQEVQEFSKII